MTMPRPTALTPQTQEDILLAIRAGVPLEVAAAAAGIAPNTFGEWMRRGEGHDRERPATEPYRTFAREVRRAEAVAHALVIGAIRKAVQKGDPRILLGWARMRWPRYYADRIEVTGASGGPLQVIEGMSDHEREVLRDILVAAIAEEESREVKV